MHGKGLLPTRLPRLIHMLPSFCWLCKLAFDGKFPHRRKQQGKQKVDRPATSHHLDRERGEPGHRLFQWSCSHRHDYQPCRRNRRCQGRDSSPCRQPGQILHICQSVMFIYFKINIIYLKHIHGSLNYMTPINGL